jgi:drug/metabolite transporter (DMT)-like permease
VGGVAVLQAPHLAGLSAEASGRLAAGGALVVLASMTAALANALLKRGVVRASPLALTGGQSLAGGAVLLAAALMVERGRPFAFTPRAIGAVAYLAIFATVITYLGLYWLMPRVPLAVVATIPLLDTTLAVALGAAVLGEPLTWNLAAGGAMVLAAAALAGLSRAPRAPQRAT